MALLQKEGLYRRVNHGNLFTLLFTRFFIEFVKEHQAESIDTNAVLNMGQYLSIPCILFGLFFVFRSFKNQVPDPVAEHQKRLANEEGSSVNKSETTQ